jgi:hypothetical protein
VGRIFESTKEKVIESCRKLHNGEYILCIFTYFSFLNDKVEEYDSGDCSTHDGEEI